MGEAQFGPLFVETNQLMCGLVRMSEAPAHTFCQMMMSQKCTFCMRPSASKRLHLFVFLPDIAKTIRRNLRGEVRHSGISNTLSWVWSSISNWRVPSVKDPNPPVYLASRLDRPKKTRRRKRPPQAIFRPLQTRPPRRRIQEPRQRPPRPSRTEEQYHHHHRPVEDRYLAPPVTQLPPPPTPVPQSPETLPSPPPTSQSYWDDHTYFSKEPKLNQRGSNWQKHSRVEEEAGGHHNYDDRTYYDLYHGDRQLLRRRLGVGGGAVRKGPSTGSPYKYYRPPQFGSLNHRPL